MQSILISILFFLSATNIGYLLWHYFIQNKTLKLFDLLCSLIIGSVILTYAIFIISLILGKMNLFINYLVIILVLGISSCYIWKKHLNFKINFSKKNLWLIIACLIPVVYFFFAFRNLLFWENGNLMAGWITVWGDWQAHLTYVSSFVYGNNFPPQLPIYAGQTFAYPFMADFLSAILANLGVNLFQSLIIPSFIFTLISFLLLVNLVYILTKKLLVGVIATLLFFFNGGLGFIYVLYYGINSSEMTKILDKNIQWISILTSQFIPQRGFAFGFPITIICLYLLLQIVQDKIKYKTFLLNGVLIGLLPLIHMHSFLVLIYLSVILYFIKAKHIKHWLLFSLPIFLFAIPVYYFFYSKGAAFNAFRFHFGWMAKSVNDFLPFYFWNFGVMIILPIIGFFIADRKIRNYSLPFIFIFITANLFIFQPWDWDNTKLLTYWYLAACVISAILLDKMIKSKFVIFSVFGLILFVVSIFSGLSDAKALLYPQNNKNQMFSTEQLQIAEYIRNNMSTNSIFLTADNHDNLVPSLTGRKVLLGYPGWLWSYGVNYWTRQDEIAKIKKGDINALVLLQKYKVDYVIIGPTEMTQQFNLAYFKNNFDIVYQKDNYYIFKISK